MDEIIIESWADFSVLSNELIKFMDDNRVIYRGQSNSVWNLTSSFARMMINNPKIRVIDSLQIEEDMLTYFSDRARLYDEIPSNRDQLTVLDWWAFMQHYGAPTRILDWSLSPYVALYFAVEGHYDQDGALFLLRADTLDSVQRLKQKIEFPVGVLDGKDEFSDFFLNQYILQLKNESYIKCLYVPRGTHWTNRMVAQQSVHTIGTEILIGLDVQVDELEKEYKLPKIKKSELGPIVKFIIPKGLKSEFLVNLNSMNINPTTLFPGIEGLGKTTEKFVEQRIKSRLDLPDNL